MPAHLQPPSLDAVNQAISILLGGVQAVGTTSECNTDECATESSEIAELELAASAIHDELLRRAALLKRRASHSQWIYRLPPEVFAEILMLDIVTSDPAEKWRRIPSFRRKQLSTQPKIPRRTELCHVSHLFLQTILGTPRLWSDIQWGRDDYALCLKMSAQAPLSIRCSEFTGAGSLATTDEFLRAIWENSGRWRTLSLRLYISTKRLQFLEFESPQLRDLNLDMEPEIGATPDEHEPRSSIIKISGHPSIRNLSLYRAGLFQWNDLDLSRLRLLSLSSMREGAPSVKKLLEILEVGAPSLRRLELYQVDLASSSKEHQLEPQLIHLPALLSLSLGELPAGLIHYLIRVIRSPQLQQIYVHELFPQHLDNPGSDQNPYHHFFQVLIPALASATTSLTICNEVSLKAVNLSVDDTSGQISSWPDSDLTTKYTNFGVEAEDPLQAVQQMVKFITLNRIALPLTICANGFFPSAYDPVSPTISYFPAEVLGKLPTVTKISAAGLADAMNILSFLGSTRRDEETGRLGWACPQLKLLEFNEVEGLTLEHGQAFFDARYGDGNPLLVEGEFVQRLAPRVTIEHPIFWEG
ncbi:hypothetical protein FRC04_009382 [Tulasnella sp. 424]|nr:hypothetical protein FRC04_009382 [Tulasnella sp. 424]KAG8973225.1 hypothetical protein FRC05_008939 [Tulasnella sp. 425]